jgi:hypothetical protein
VKPSQDHFTPILTKRRLFNVKQVEQDVLEFSQSAPFDCKDPYMNKRPIYLLKSPFKNRPAVVFFQYPPQINIPKKVDPCSLIQLEEGAFKLRFKITDSVHTYSPVVNALCWAGFAQTDGA